MRICNTLDTGLLWCGKVIITIQSSNHILGAGQSIAHWQNCILIWGRCWESIKSFSGPEWKIGRLWKQYPIGARRKINKIYWLHPLSTVGFTLNMLRMSTPTHGLILASSYACAPKSAMELIFQGFFLQHGYARLVGSCSISQHTVSLTCISCFN